MYAHVCRDVHRPKGDVFNRDAGIRVQSSSGSDCVWRAGTHAQYSVVAFKHVSVAGDFKSNVLVSDDHHRLQVSQVSVHPPHFRQLHTRAQQLSCGEVEEMRMNGWACTDERKHEAAERRAAKLCPPLPPPLSLPLSLSLSISLSPLLPSPSPSLPSFPLSLSRSFYAVIVPGEREEGESAHSLTHSTSSLTHSLADSAARPARPTRPAEDI
eukprot:GHVU01107064.1.p1 GENE.GHVU01107064.1~~GHVU01107064.1.p1  ORF type:complete len:212 (-),score=24.04 GHVU01107064.1:1398-2033(-)